MRVTPFRYYSDVLFLALRDERSYDTIPNFTVRSSGGGWGRRRQGVAGLPQQREF